jgi:tetratricopeptide (TPR) repeat protein
MAATILHTIVIFITLIGVAVAAPAQRRRATQKKPPATPAAPQQAEFNKLAKQADAAREAGRLEEAIRLYNQALQLNPQWPAGWWYLSSIFYDRDRYSEARETLRILLSHDAKNGPAWALIGLCEFQLRNYDPALADIQYARVLGMGNNKEFINVTRYHAGILMTRSSQFELGYEALREFAREGNESPNVIEALGLNILRMPFLPTEAPPDKRELILLAGRAAFNQAARRVQDTERAFKELLARYPDAPNVHYAYGVFLLIDLPDAALDEFRRELQVSPSNVPAMLQIAFEYIKRNDFENAKPYAQQAVEAAPNLFATHNALGRVLLELGKIDEAIQELEIGVKQAPDSPEMRFALARAYARAGRKEDAARERGTFLELDKQRRTELNGPQSVGGIKARPTDKNPPR